MEMIAAVLQGRTISQDRNASHTRAKASPAFCLLKKGISEQTWELSNLASFSAESQRHKSAGFSA